MINILKKFLNVILIPFLLVFKITILIFITIPILFIYIINVNLLYFEVYLIFIVLFQFLNGYIIFLDIIIIWI